MAELFTLDSVFGDGYRSELLSIALALLAENAGQSEAFKKAHRGTRETIKELRAENERLVCLVMKCLSQGCSDSDDRVNHMFISAWEDAVEELENRGLIDGSEAAGFTLLWDKIGGEI